MTKEYNLIEIFKPHKLDQNFEELYKEILEKQKAGEVSIDKKML